MIRNVIVVHRLESIFHEIKCNGMTSFMEFMTSLRGRPLHVHGGAKKNFEIHEFLVRIGEKNV